MVMASVGKSFYSWAPGPGKSPNSRPFVPSVHHGLLGEARTVPEITPPMFFATQGVL